MFSFWDKDYMPTDAFVISMAIFALIIAVKPFWAMCGND